MSAKWRKCTWELNLLGPEEYGKELYTERDMMKNLISLIQKWSPGAP